MLERQNFFVHEYQGLLKLGNAYDILDPDTQEHIGIAQEKAGILVYLLRLFVNKNMLPTKICVYRGNDPKDESQLEFTIERKFILLGGGIEVVDAQTQKKVGSFASKLISLGGAFRIFNMAGREIAQVKGDWKATNFKIVDKDRELGMISKQWGGAIRELLTTMDSYVVSLEKLYQRSDTILFLASALAVDILFKD